MEEIMSRRAMGVRRIAILIALVAAVAASAASGQGKCHPPLTGELHVPVPGRSFSVLPSPDGCWVFVSMHARPDGTGGGLAVIDMHGAVPKLARTIPGDPATRRRAGMALTHDGRFLLLALPDRISVYRVDKLTTGDGNALVGEFRPQIPRIDEPPDYFQFAVTSNDRFLFVSGHNSEAITVINLEETRRSNFQKFSVVGDIPVGWGANAVILSGDGRYLYAVSQIADDNWKWKKVCRAPGAPPSAAPNHYTGAVHVIDVARAVSDPAHSVLTTTPAACDPVRLILDKAGKRAYVTSRSDYKVLVFDVGRLRLDPANALITSVPTRTGPVGIALLDSGKRMAVGNAVRFTGGKKDIEGVSIIDTKTNATQPRVAGNVPSTGPVDITLMANGSILLVANFESEQVTFLRVRDLPR